MAEELKWYVIHTYSGYENTVKATIEKAVVQRGLDAEIQNISIPMETVEELTDNGPKEITRKVFPGYVLIKMIMNDANWQLIRNVRGVTGFVGDGTEAIPLTDQEVAALNVEPRVEVALDYSIGDTVRITEGALETFLGVVEEIDAEHRKVRVTVDMFGRETPVDLDLDQVESIIE